MSPLDRQSLQIILDANFDRETVAAGRACQREWRVWYCMVEKLKGHRNTWRIDSKVHEEASKSRLPQIFVSQDDPGWTLQAGCSCPVARNCKHSAATLLHLIQNPHLIPKTALDFTPGSVFSRLTAPPPVPARPAPRPPAPAKPSSPPPKIEPDWNSWLNRLQETAAPPAAATPAPAPAPPASPDQLLYVLQPEEQTLNVELIVARPLKNGGFSDARPCDPALLLRGDAPLPAYIQPSDADLVRNLLLSQPNFASFQLFIDAAGIESLKKILATGRCHWKGTGPEHPALSLGPARRAAPVWRDGPDGRQTTALDITPPAELILRSPPWYLDEPAASCGPLKTGVPPTVVAAWLKAPPLLPEDAFVVLRKVKSRLKGLRLPAPRPLEVEQVDEVKPVPCLRLYSAAVPIRPAGYYGRVARDENRDEFLNFARLEFDYLGIRVRPDTTGPVRQYSPGLLRIAKRDFAAEQEAEDRLGETGLDQADFVFLERDLGEHALDFTIDEDELWMDFVHLNVPLLRQEGWRVEIDDAFQFRLAEPEHWYTDAAPESSNDWFGLELGVVLDGQQVNLLPILLDLLRKSPDSLDLNEMDAVECFLVPLPDGRKLPFPAERARQILGVLLDLSSAGELMPGGRLRLNKLRTAELAGEAGWRWLGNTELREMSGRLRDFKGIRPVPPPASLRAELRPYQIEGLAWLQFLREYGLAGILADDMGLGKTVQTLAHLLVEKEAGRMDRPSLVVAPTSLMPNWRQETERFAPSLRFLVLHGSDRKEHFERLAGHDLVFTSYPLLPRDQAVLLQQEFHYVILDEAQFIKNPKTTYAQIACQLKARHRLCLTGTPMENHLGELWSLFQFLLPGFLSDEIRFNSIFRRPIEKGKNEDRRQLLARRVGPFILRRRKQDVVKELPPKTEIVQNVDLQGAQRDLYESVRLAMHQRVQAEVARKGMSRAHIIILDALLKLRQICCHPQLLKLPSAQKVTESAKLNLLMDMLPSMIDEGRRILLFSQFTSMLALIQQTLDLARIPYVLLTGQTTDRTTPVARFQKGETPLFLISLKAGGTGLNLTAADTVIHYDPWWNPAVETQATDRAHRIGQQKQVFVYKLITVGTVEEKIAAMQLRKRELVEGLLDEKRAENSKLTAEDLDVLFSPLG